MDEAIRRLRSEARQLAHWKVPTAIRYPVPFRAAAAALTRPQLEPRWIGASQRAGREVARGGKGPAARVATKVYRHLLGPDLHRLR
jgi:hypothetical protein